MKINANRGKWDKRKMEEAIKSVVEQKLSIRQAAERYDVPKSSIHDRLKVLKSGREVTYYPKLGRFEVTFSEDVSKQLYEHIKQLDDRLMPLTRKEFLKLAFDLAESLKIPHRFNKEKGMAGKDFYYNFKKQFPDIALRTPESTSIARAVGFNRPQVDRFYNQLNQLQEKYQFSPSRIYNADETGVSNVHKNDKVLSIKGKKQVGKLTSAERGRNITVTFAMNVTGHFIPPLFIFPRKKMDKNGRLMIGAPPESIAVPQETGWMNGDVFLRWLQHFKQHALPTKTNPILLILDGHASHKELAVLEYARKNNIHMLSTPPHTTHKLQPLDRTFFKPFKAAFATASASWMRRNPAARITDYDIAALVSEAFSKAARLDIAQNGFKCTGIYPFNPNIFTEVDFLPSAMTDITQNIASNKNNNQDPVAHVSSPVPSTSRAFLETEPVPSTSAADLLNELSPLPDGSRKRLVVRARKTQRSEILTSSPYKKDAQDRQKSKSSKKDEAKTRKGKIVKTTLKTKKNAQSLSLTDREKETECIICGETFEEDWIQCHECKDWAHEDCVDIDSSDINYSCDICKAKKRLGHR